MPKARWTSAGLVLLLAGTNAGQEPDETFFETKIRPLLAAKCYGCHSEEKGKRKGGLVLDTKEGWSKGGDSGPALVPGEPETSRLVRAVRYTDESLRMPPPGKLADAEIADLETWIKMGAPDPRTAPAAASAHAMAPPPAIDWDAARKHWAFQPARDAGPPEVRDAAWCANPIDRFVLARLEAEGFRPASEADRRTLIRRATFDLTGLPPTEEEITAFLADGNPDAFARVVDRLLASPHYGERSARRWLDLARYADSNGLDENLALGNAWRYRDWVVRAFNDDKPYDAFVREQLAGDLLPPAGDPAKDFDAWTATGFLVLGPKMLAEQDKEKLVLDVVDEQIDVASRTFLGLTVACARCHDHKFDPVPARDYYALAGIFKSTSTMAHLDHVSRWRERELAPPGKVAEAAAWKKAFAEAEASVKTLAEDARRAAVADLRRQTAAYLEAAAAAAAEAVFVEAEESSRGNLVTDTDHWGTPEAPVARSGNPSEHPQFIEFDLTIAGGGRHRIEARFAAKESRPMRALLNGEVIASEALKETTKDWFPRDQRWSTVAVAGLRPGRNVLRLERDGPVPHLDKILVTRAADAEGAPGWPAYVPAAAGLVPEVVRHGADRLVTAGRRGDPVLGLWVAALGDTGARPGRPEDPGAASNGSASIPVPTGVAGLAVAYRQDPPGLAAAWEKLRAARDSGALKLVPPVAALLDAPAPSSAAELAARHQAVFAVAALAWDKKRAATPPDQPAKLDDPDLDAVAAALHGPGGLLELPADAREDAFPPAVREKLAAARSAVEELKPRRPPEFDRALAVADGPTVDLPVHIRGDHLNLGPEPVPRGFLQVTAHLVAPPEMPKAASGRLELARWLTDPAHPLTARVMANRVWQQHFGHGLVRTPSNFGLRGEAPTHPELLDWLARELVRGGWSVKALHRTILLSRAWRQAVLGDPAASGKDPGNRLLARQNRRRLDSEGVRDAILAVSGALDRTFGGSLLGVGNGDYVTNDQSADKARYAAPRRTLYLPVIRNAMADLFTLFDYPDSSTHLEQRPESIVPGQALWFMNSPFVLEESARFARRVLDGAAAGGDRERIGRAYVLAYGRPPSEEDLARAGRWLARGAAGGAAAPPPESGPDLRAWTGLCQVLLAANEFIHVE